MGSEDNQLKFFDANSNRQIKTIVAHTEGVTSLMFQNTANNKNGQGIMLSGGHDGAIRGWDLRTFQCMFDIPAHRRKFDEGVLCLASCDKYPLIASGKCSVDV